LGGPFARSGPRWYTIPAHRPFTLDLARGLAEALAPLGPEALAEAVVLTPTRRGARALAEAFLAVSGGRAVLLPQVRALGDLDEGEPPFEPGDLVLDLPPAVSAYRRRFELARLFAICSTARSTRPPPWSWPIPWPASSTACRSRRPTAKGSTPWPRPTWRSTGKSRPSS